METVWVAYITWSDSFTDYTGRHWPVNTTLVFQKEPDARHFLKEEAYRRTIGYDDIAYIQVCEERM